jgi:hypothetical protein
VFGVKKQRPSNAERINDLKTYYHGLRYIDEIFKLLPKNADIIKKDMLIDEVLALGRIYPIKIPA